MIDFGCGYGEPLALVPKWNTILWAYPNDPRLLGLAELSDPRKVLSSMQRAPRAFGLPDDQRPVSIQAQLSKYVPGARCGSIFTVKLDPGGGGDGAGTGTEGGAL